MRIRFKDEEWVGRRGDYYPNIYTPILSIERSRSATPTTIAEVIDAGSERHLSSLFLFKPVLTGVLCQFEDDHDNSWYSRCTLELAS